MEIYFEMFLSEVMTTLIHLGSLLFNSCSDNNIMCEDISESKLTCI